MTAVARTLRAGHWSDRPTPTHPDPEDPRIETKADKAVAAVVWVVIAPLLSVGVVTGLAKLLPVLIAYLIRN